jgi:hypothetical protein
MRRTQQFLSTNEGGGRKIVSGGQSVIARTLSHFVVTLVSVFLGFSLIPFSSSLPNLLEIVQRARPSFNPKGTCPRWARSPAAPGGPMRHTQQILSTSEVEKKSRMFGLVSFALAKVSVPLALM